MSYYPDSESHIRDIVRVVMNVWLLCYIKELEHATGNYKSNLAAKTDFINFKAEDDKLGINELIHVKTGLNNLKQK